jgi:DNA-binding NarL/FixJ family response regulator
LQGEGTRPVCAELELTKAAEAYLKAAQRVTRKAQRNTELVARRASQPRIIVMTAYETEEDIRQPLKVGAKAFLVKGSHPLIYSLWAKVFWY